MCSRRGVFGMIARVGFHTNRPKGTIKFKDCGYVHRYDSAFMNEALATGIHFNHDNNVRFLFGGLVSTKRNVNISRHLPFHHTDVFDVVKDVQKYPEFLPYCCHCEVRKSFNRKSLVAALTFEHQLLASRETVTYDVSWEEPKAVFSVAENTTFCKKIAYTWRFTPRINGCLAEVEMDLEFRSSSTAILFDSFSHAVQKRIMDAFVQRLKDSQAPIISTES